MFKYLLSVTIDILTVVTLHKLVITADGNTNEMVWLYNLGITCF